MRTNYNTTIINAIIIQAGLQIFYKNVIFIYIFYKYIIIMY